MVLFSRSVVSNSVTPWTAAVCQDSLSFTISLSFRKFMSIESVIPANLIFCHPLLFLPSVFSTSGSFLLSWLFESGGQRIGASASTSVFPMNIQGWFPSRLIGLVSFQSKGFSRVLPTPQFKSINSSVVSFPYSPTLASIHDYWKNHSLDYMDLCWQSGTPAF